MGYVAYDGGQGNEYADGSGIDNGQEKRNDRKENRGSRNSAVKEKSAAGRRYDVQAPDASNVLEGYRADILNGFEAPQERYNPVSCVLYIWIVWRRSSRGFEG